MAINELEQVSPNDGQGYIKAKQLIAEYTSNLAQIRVRKHEEETSLQAFDNANNKLNNLLANYSSDSDKNRTIAKIEGIINELNKVKSGTTVYNEAQKLKLLAENKIKEFQGKK